MSNDRRTIPAVMRQACPLGVGAAAVVAALLAMSGFAYAGEDGKNKLPATGDCTFNSKLPLRVWVVPEADALAREIRRTSWAKPIVIPRCASWYVEPAGRLDMGALAEEIASKGIPGLRLPAAVDSDLSHLKGLTGLRKLLLGSWGVPGRAKTTDAGMAHLKGLTGLRELNLRYREVTGAGLAHLKHLTGLRVLYL